MYCQIPVRFKDTWFKFNRWFGLILFSNKEQKRQVPDTSAYKKLAFECVKNPYKLKKPVMVKREPPRVKSWVKTYAKVLTYLYLKCYPLANLIFSNLRLNVFQNGEDANWFYRSLSYGHDQRILCLPRAVFIASTSKEFKKSGVLFIGIFPPMRNLHAWVIEGDTHCDICDIIWTSYRPIYAKY